MSAKNPVSNITSFAKKTQQRKSNYLFDFILIPSNPVLILEAT